MLKNQTLFILQYNVNNSRTQIMISLFEIKDIEDYDILIIQKFWKNSFQLTTNNRFSQQFELFYISNAITKMCLFVNKKIAKIVYFHTFHNKNLISLRMQIANDKIINIHNMYNSCKSSNDISVIFSLKNAIQKRLNEKHVVIENFNLHHSSWRESHVKANANAYEFIDTMKKCKLKRITSIELITWSRHTSENIIDLIYTTSLLKDSLIETSIDENMNNHSNHRSIKTILNLRTKAIESRSTRIWKKTNVDIFRKKLKARLSSSETFSSSDEIYNNQTEKIDCQIKKLIEVIQAIIELFISLNISNVYAKSKFTEKCKQISRTIKSIKKRYQRNDKFENLWVIYKKARNHLNHVIDKIMRAQYKKKIEKRCDTSDSMWKTCKWARNKTSRKICLSILHDHSFMLSKIDSVKKTLILLKKFFFSFSTIVLSDIQKVTYNQDLKLKKIQFHEMLRIIVKQISSKISKNDDIINKIWKWISDIIASHLQRIFNVDLNEDYCSKHFRKSIIIALRKSQKKFYSLAASYRFIVLFNTISKLMKFILVRRINFLTKKHDLLSRTHFEVKKVVSIEHALHYMMKRIHSTWNKKKIIVIMFLDVMKTFDNIARLRLLHNLRIKRFDEKLMKFIDFFLFNKMTILKTSEYDIEWLKIFIKISQDSLMSSILFFFYNASLLKKLERRSIFASDFVDDVKMMTKSNIFEECFKIIVKVHEKCCVSWLLTHEVKFASFKYQIICFSRRRNTNVIEFIRFSEFNQVIKVSKKMKFLRIIMNTKLNWKTQVSQNKTKILKSIEALRSLDDTAWNAKFSRMKQMMQTIFISQFTYACFVWYTSVREKSHSKKIIKNLTSVQYQIEKIITKAYKTISMKTFNIEVNSMLMHLRLNKFISATTIRLITSSTYETIIRDRFIKKSRSVNSLKKLVNRFERKTDIKTHDMKKITLFVALSWWISSIARIMKNKKKVEKYHRTQLTTNSINYIYIDENDINDKVDSTTIFSKTNSTTTRAYLRLITSYTIYSAELYDIVLTMSMRLHSFSKSTRKSKLVICIDNQTAIQTMHDSKINFDQYLMKWIIWLIDDLRIKYIEIKLHWISIHIDIENNEQTNIAIKQITDWKLKKRDRKRKEMNIDHKAQQTSVQMLKSAVKIVMNKTVKQQWNQEWRDCDKDRVLFKITSKSNTAVLRLHEKLSKKLSAIAIQFRTIKINLQTFLFSKKKIESLMCSCMCNKQTIKHVLFECKRLKRLRKSLWTNEIRKAKWKKLKLMNVLINSINLTKTTKFIENSEFIDHLRAHIENDEI